MTVSSLTIASTPADKLSGVTGHNFSEQCKISVRPTNLHSGEWTEEFPMTACDYTIASREVGETTAPMVDDTGDKGFFLYSPDQTEVLQALARAYHNVDILTGVQVTLPFTLADPAAGVVAVETFTQSDMDLLMDSLISPHEVETGFILPEDVCVEHIEDNEVEGDVTLAEDSIQLDIKSIIVAAEEEEDPVLALCLCLKVQTLETAEVTLSLPASIKFTYSEEPKLMTLAVADAQDYDAYYPVDDYLTLASERTGARIVLNSTTGEVEAKPSLQNDHLSFDLRAASDERHIMLGGRSIEMVLSAEYLTTRTMVKTVTLVSAVVDGQNVGVADNKFIIPGYDAAGSHTGEPTQPEAHKTLGGAHLVAVDLSPDDYDPATDEYKYETTGHFRVVYSDTGRPMAAKANATNSATVNTTTVYVVDDSQYTDEYGTHTVSIQFS